MPHGSHSSESDPDLFPSVQLSNTHTHSDLVPLDFGGQLSSRSIRFSSISAPKKRPFSPSLVASSSVSSSPHLSCAPPSSEAPSVPTSSIVPVQAKHNGRRLHHRYLNKLQKIQDSQVSLETVLSPVSLGETIFIPSKRSTMRQLPVSIVTDAAVADDALISPVSVQSARPWGCPSAASQLETPGSLSGFLEPVSVQSARPRGCPSAAFQLETHFLTPLVQSACPRESPCAASVSWETVSLETPGLTGLLSPHGTTMVPTPFSAESTGPSSSDSDSLVALLNEILPLQSCDEQSLHLVDIFPTLADLSFSQIIDRSTIYLKAAALSRASADALIQHALDPSSITVDPNLVAQHSFIADHHGLPSLLRQLFDNLSEGTLQPLNSCDSAIVKAAMPGATALWDSLTDGSSISCINSFVPSDNYLHGRVPPPW